MRSSQEEKYVRMRLRKAGVQSLLFYFFRCIPIKKKKMVFCCIEGSTGYSCNPKYIAEEILERMEKKGSSYELVWLVNDTAKQFPAGIKVVRNTLWNRAYHLTTAAIWIDNSRKQLEVRKRKGQTYIQTWHAKLGFKPTCLDRGSSFSKIAYQVSKHDADMTDYVLSNSKWYEDTLPTGMLYEGAVIRSGSPRCDLLVAPVEHFRDKVREKYHLSGDARLILYAPTFRGGSQGTGRMIETGEQLVDLAILVQAMEERFGGNWYVMLRLHPQLASQNTTVPVDTRMAGKVLDISREDDMYELLAGTDAFITDYSSAAFDAAIMKIPVFIYAEDLQEYEKERGSLLWDMEKLPFPVARDSQQLADVIRDFKESEYRKALDELFVSVDLLEDGKASARVADLIEELIP